MQIVVDTSALLCILLGEPDKKRIVDLVAGHELAAPDVLPYEIGNALIGLHRRGLLGAPNVAAVWTNYETIPVELRPVDIGEALRLAASRAIYAYDAYFLSCALRNRLPLLTLDKTMRRVGTELNLTVWS